MTGDDRLDAAGAAARLAAAVDSGRRAVLVLRPEPGVAARRRVIVAEGGATGSLGDEVMDRAADRRAQALLSGEGEEGMVDGLYAELHAPRPELVVVGAGHIAQPLASIGSLLGFRVSVLDDREDFARRERFPDADRVVRVDFQDPFAEVPMHAASHVVLVTRGHRYDYECLRRILSDDPLPPYVGMIGSRRRVRATWAALGREGIPSERIATVRAPVGLDLGAQTPAEIAVSVAAEIVMVGRGGSGRPLREVERVLERFGDASPDRGAELLP